MSLWLPSSSYRIWLLWPLSQMVVPWEVVLLGWAPSTPMGACPTTIGAPSRLTYRHGSSGVPGDPCTGKGKTISFSLFIISVGAIPPRHNTFEASVATNLERKQQEEENYSKKCALCLSLQAWAGLICLSCLAPPSSSHCCQSRD